MGYILYHIPTKRRIKWFFTEKGAKTSRTNFNRSACGWEYDVMTETKFHNKYIVGTDINSSIETFSDPSTKLF